MGKRNRERRREKQRRRARPGRAFDAAVVERVVLAAAEALHLQDQAAYADVVPMLVTGPPVQGGARLVDRAVAHCLEHAVAGAWQHGWQPADVPRVVGRMLTATHARIAGAAVVAEARRYPQPSLDPRWRDQLREVGGGTGDITGTQWWAPDAGAGRPHSVRRAIETLSVLLHLPPLPKLCPPPGEAGPAAAVATAMDSRALGRVRALLAKAESTTFPEEAEALTAKAQELMARHAVDQAMLDAEDSSDSGSMGPSGRRLGVDDPYAGAKALLLEEVAAANRCRSVWSPDLGFATVFGFELDLATVELLYTSLLVQATAAMAAAGSRVDRHGRSRTRSFRQSFLVAYATRIGARLREAAKASEAAAAEEYGPSLLPVLAARSHAVDEARDAVFSNVTQRSFSPSNHDGWRAGLVAAELASLSAHPEMEGRPVSA